MNLIKKIIYTQIIPFVGRICKKRNKYINVIYYHDIVKTHGQSFMRTNIEIFRKQMEYLSKKGYKTYTFDELNEEKENQRYGVNRVLITFDDGWKSNYSEIINLMLDLGLKYNVFLEVGKIGKDPEYLTWNEVKSMYQTGMVGFGAHTYSHPNMSKLCNYDFNKEILEANAIIAHELGYKPTDFCFPFGAYGEESLREIVESGQYDRVYTSDLAYSYPMGNVIVMGRNGISNDESFSVFRNKTAGYYNIFKNLIGK